MGEVASVSSWTMRGAGESLERERHPDPAESFPDSTYLNKARLMAGEPFQR